ncbi:MAG TPA: S41 family peptidase [Vicinamibacterales bacterium]
MTFRLPPAAGIAILALTVAPVFAQAPATGLVAATPLETFDAAWRVLRDQSVASTISSVDWDALAAELRPRAERATTDEEARALIREMLARVGQSHFAVLPGAIASMVDAPAAGDHTGTVGFDVRLSDDDLVVTRVEPGGPADRAGIRPGWSLVRVGPRPVADVLAAAGTGPEHVRAFHSWALGTGLLRGRVGEATTLEFVDGAGNHVTRTVVRAPEQGELVKLGLLPPLHARLDAREIVRGDRRFGVIAFNVWMTALSRPFDEAVDRFRAADGIVIDLRGNPGGLMTMIMGISGHFVEAPIPLGTMRTREAELRLVANPRLVSPAGRLVEPYGGPLAILVDSSSYSASEIFAGGMQAIRRARVFGTRTPGGALPAVIERLPGGDVLQYAIGDFVTAAGDRIEGRGVVPDEVVVPRRDDLLAGRDPILEAALAWLATGAGR